MCKLLGTCDYVNAPENEQNKPTEHSLSIDFKIWAEHFSEYLILMQSHITVSMSIIPVQCSEIQRI